MEPIKILLQGENSAYTPKSQPKIPTRVCQGRVVTADLPTLGTNPKRTQRESETQRSKGLSCPANTLADSPRPWGRRPAVTGRTIRYPRADGPLITTERPGKHPNTRTVRTWSSDGPRATRAARTVRDPQADSPATTRTIR
jgi:hypothetical protein